MCVLVPVHSLTNDPVWEAMCAILVFCGVFCEQFNHFLRFEFSTRAKVQSSSGLSEQDGEDLKKRRK